MIVRRIGLATSVTLFLVVALFAVSVSAHGRGTMCNDWNDPECEPCDHDASGQRIGICIVATDHHGEGGSGGGGDAGGGDAGGGGGDDGGSGDAGGGGGAPAGPVTSCVEVGNIGDVKTDGESSWVSTEFRCTVTPPGTIYTDYRDVCFMGPCLDDPIDPAAPPPPPPPTFFRDSLYVGIPPLPPPAVVAPDQPVVGVPAFLQVEGLAPRSASGGIPGIEVTVTATPTGVVWTFADHERTCSSGGAGFTPERLDRALAQDDGLIDDGEVCTYLFTTSSDKEVGGPLPATVVTVWDYSWSLNGVDQVFSPGIVSPATTFDLTVREYQAVITD